MRLSRVADLEHIIELQSIADPLDQAYGGVLIIVCWQSSSVYAAVSQSSFSGNNVDASCMDECFSVGNSLYTLQAVSPYRSSVDGFARI